MYGIVKSVIYCSANPKGSTCLLTFGFHGITTACYHGYYIVIYRLSSSISTLNLINLANIHVKQYKH